MTEESEPKVLRNLIALLARIDERTKEMQIDFKEFRDSVENRFDDYTKKGDFDPIRKLVYGFVGFIMLSVGGMFIAMLIRSNNLPFDAVLPQNPSIIRPAGPPSTQPR